LVTAISKSQNIPAHPRSQAEGEKDPRAERYRPKPLPADHKPIDVLKKIVSDDRKQWEMDLNAHGGKNMYIFDISVDPVEQGKGVRTGLLKFGTDICETNISVLLGMAGYPASARLGLKTSEGWKWIWTTMRTASNGRGTGKRRTRGHTLLGTVNTSQSPEYNAREEANV
jgi:hypothetical protein